MAADLAIHEASPLDKKRWNEFVLASGADHHSYLYEWSTVIARVFKQKPVYLMAESVSRELVGVLPLVEFKSALFGRSLISTPFLNAGGIVSASPAAERALCNHSIEIHGRLGTSYIELRNIQRSNVLGDQFNCSSHKVAYELTLTPPDAMFSSFSKKLRAQIRRPQKSGFTVDYYSAGDDIGRGVADFYKIFSRNMRDLGTPVYSRRLILTILEEFGARATIAIVSGPRGPAACGLLIGCGERVEILLASSIREFNADAPNMLLYWETMQWAYNKGYKVFDFGRSTPDSGPARFKEQWGAAKRELHWYYYPKSKLGSSVQSGDSGSFGLAVKLWKMLPVPFANCLGPFISRQIP